MLNIISEGFQFENNSTINRFFKDIKMGQFLRKCNFTKKQGPSCLVILQLLFTLVFTKKNFYRTQKGSKQIPFNKDVIYRFLQTAHFNWRKLLLQVSKYVINTNIEPLTDEKRTNVFIIDDSFYNRNRSKKVELLARVHDHTDHKYKRGYRMLTLGWSDGNTFLPLSFSLLSSTKDKNRLYPCIKPMHGNSNGAKRRQEAIRKGTDMAVELVKQALNAGHQAKYVLFDSWFAFPTVISSYLEQDVHVIARLKNMHRIYYCLDDEKLTLNQLYKHVRKKRGRARILATPIVTVHVKDKPSYQAKIVFVRDRNHQKHWIAIISTDLTLDSEEVVRLYGKRWNIEVFFKMSKSYLALAKEFQCRYYDSLVAHTTIVFLRYIMLALEERRQKDIKTQGELFFYLADELEDIKFYEAFAIILEALRKTLSDNICLAKEELSRLIECFLNNLPNSLKHYFVAISCES